MKSLKKLVLALAAVVVVVAIGLPRLQSQQSQKMRKDPHLVLLVAVDQLRFDYLTRFRDEYTGGFDRLLHNGANFVNAHLDHYPTVTAVGHSTMFSGATPKISGIVGNDWYDREDGEEVTNVSDKKVQLLGGPPGYGSSPHRLLVSTVGDELKRARTDGPKVIGISMKDRGAILPSGHMADAAYWFESDTGTFVSSTYYFPDLPQWVKDFNGSHLADKYAGRDWEYGPGTPNGTFKLPSEAGAKLSEAVYSSPFGNELLESFVEAAIKNEKLGQRQATDVLTVSFSSNDAVGHSFGPDSPQVHDISVKTDKILGKLFDYLDKTIGMAHVTVILTADHGVMPLPEVLQSSKLPGGRYKVNLFDTINKALVAKFGEGKWIEGTAGTSPYFDRKLAAEKKLSMADVERVAAESVENLPHVARVYTRTQLLRGEVPLDPITQKVARSFNARRSGDLEIILDPYWIRGANGTTHGAPYSYDSHIPLIFMGPGIKPGRYVRPVVLNDLAPSLATLLEIETPSGSVGRPLHEMMSFAADGK